MTMCDLAIEFAAGVIKDRLSHMRKHFGDEAVEEVLRQADLVARTQGVQSTAQSPGTHLASAMALVEDYVLPAEAGPSGTNDTVEAAVCLRRRIRDAQTCWSTLEALRSKQGR